MANLSDQTRAQQVLTYLRLRKGQWVDGPELANERVGGSEGLRRLRDEKARLAAEGLRVEKRKHPDPDRDIWQYRLVDGPLVPAAGGVDRARGDVPARPEQTPLKYERLPTKLAFGEAIPCPGCDGKGRRVDPGTRRQGPCTRCNGFGIVPVPRHA